MSRYHTLLFDADNTLFDFHKAEEVAFYKTASQYDIKANEEMLNIYIKINKPLWRELELGTITKAELVVLRFKELFSHYGISANAEDFNRDYLYNLGDGSQLLPYASHLIKELSENYKIIIVTNGVASTQRRRIDASEIKEYIDNIIISEEVGAEKPAAKFFDCTFSQCNIPSTEGVLIIGDSLGADILGGMNYGIDTCWFNPSVKECPSEYTPTYIINSLTDIEELLVGE